MSRMKFKRLTPEHARIYEDGNCVGNVYRQPDILNPGACYYVVHLIEDPRGFVRVHDQFRIRDVTSQRIRSHPYWQ